MESVVLIVPVLVTYLIVSGVLNEGYFGSVASGITTGSFEFVASIRRFAVRMIALEALVVGLLVCSVPLSFLAYSGLGGAVIAAVVAAPVSLAFNVATALVVAEMADIEVTE